jgi:hypothetical protein
VKHPNLGVHQTGSSSKGHEAAGALINANLGMAVLVSMVPSVAMIATGRFVAWLVYRYLGLKFVSRSWFNLDAPWAFSLFLVGALSLAISIASRH